MKVPNALIHYTFGGLVACLCFARLGHALAWILICGAAFLGWALFAGAWKGLAGRPIE